MLEVPMYNRQGKVKAFFLVDNIDSWVTQYRWNLVGKGYVARTENGKTIRLHRELFNSEDIEGKVVDHINGNPLDNRLQNLRVCTNAQNAQNKLNVYNKSTGCRNVHFSKNAYIVEMNVKGKRYYFGRYKTLEEANNVAISKRKELMPFATL